MPKKKPGSSGGRRKKPNYKLPADDHLVVKPIKRTKLEQNEAIVARLLSYEWSLFGSKDRKAAVSAAFYFGCQLADETHETDEEAYGDAKDYRRVCIRFAFKTCKVINDVECELWRSQSEDDPRLVAFSMGFEARREELLSA